MFRSQVSSRFDGDFASSVALRQPLCFLRTVRGLKTRGISHFAPKSLDAPPKLTDPYKFILRGWVQKTTQKTTQVN